MIQHFQYKPMYENRDLPGWTFSFLWNGHRVSGIYHKAGEIEWTSVLPFSDQESEEKVKQMLHELMLYHVYD
ncbi:YheE family protein [Jeotgalibacillus proteolyticus]|uniref:YheE family protein n=1 Tax=Jeotgalibacillus proteolyticus TaxID=2082395 RepID=A0A2S5GHT1_9BACL|nr:YheE family protein [Jeotgalibacillus proteolyticus]PPA72423.1 hypothetical protein C4B60_03340 [Jeotgalibacillus proteolyticus]